MNVLIRFPVEKLYLIPPFDLHKAYQLESTATHLLRQNLQKLDEAIVTDKQTYSCALVESALDSVGLLEIEKLPETYSMQTRLQPMFVQEMDNYMKVCHVKSNAPATIILVSLLTTFYDFLQLRQTFSSNSTEAERLRVGFESYSSLLKRICDIQLTATSAPSSVENLRLETNISSSKEEGCLDATVEPLQIWRKGHWMFFVFIQALIICFRRLVRLADANQIDEAKAEFNTAAKLMWASGAAMKLASSYKKEVYDSFVRPTMTLNHPNALVHNTSLSGMMSCDHDYLINVVWKKELSVFFKRMPEELQDEHEQFIVAYREGLSQGHISICDRFGGKASKSLLSSKTMAVDFLANLEGFRLDQIGSP